MTANITTLPIIHRCCAMAVGIFILLVLAVNGFALDLVEARIPVTVNVGATVSIQPPSAEAGEGTSGTVIAGTERELIIMINKSYTSISRRLHGGTIAPVAVRYGRGSVSLALSSRQFQKADIALYSVSGKRVLSGKASAISGTFNISRPNIAFGVYLLSVKGVDGNSHSTRLTHNGGKLNINVAFGGEVFSSLSKSMNSAGAGTWTITTTAAGYVTDISEFIPEAELNSAKTITLVPLSSNNPCVGFTDGTEREHYGRMKPQFCDERDGQKYVYVPIGGLVWMAENLNYDTADGVSSWCYENSADSCAKYGRLYEWDAAMTVCPAGWHLPDTAEWRDLVDAADGEDAGITLKTMTGWYDDRNGTDEVGFSAMPGGGRGADGSFSLVGEVGDWWSATDYAVSLARLWGVHVHGYSMNDGWKIKTLGASVRCVRD